MAPPISAPPARPVIAIAFASSAVTFPANPAKATLYTPTIPANRPPPDVCSNSLHTHFFEHIPYTSLNFIK